MLRGLTSHLHPGGIVAFHELDWDGVRSFPPSPTYDQCCRWIVETLRMLGAETRMGIKLHSTFVAAGLPAPSMRLGAVIGGGVNSADCLKLVTDLVETLLPDMGRLGVATAADIGVETLSERISREVISSDSVIVGRIGNRGLDSRVDPDFPLRAFVRCESCGERGHVQEFSCSPAK